MDHSFSVGKWLRYWCLIRIFFCRLELADSKPVLQVSNQHPLELTTGSQNFVETM